MFTNYHYNSFSDIVVRFFAFLSGQLNNMCCLISYARYE